MAAKFIFFFSSRRRHTRLQGDWSSDVCSSDLIDNEIIAPLESLQEEIYFNTLHFFDVLGRETRGPSLDYIGRVIPVVRPRADGKPSHARITFTGFATNRPAVVVNYRERGSATGEAR